MSQESVGKTFAVAGALAIFCGIFVSAAAVGLRPIQEENKSLDIKKNILAAAGLMTPDTNIEEAYKSSVTPRLVDLSTGNYDNTADANTYDQAKAAKDPAENRIIPAKEDIAKIKRMAKVALVYEIKKDGKLDQIVLPFHGKGLWSTMYGFLAISSDIETVRGITYYQHGETPGLGGEVDNPKWKALWPGKKLFTENGDVAIHVIKGHVAESAPNAKYEVDGLSGATLTTTGTDAMIRFWIGPEAFGKYLSKIRVKGSING
jgi:Na+-transporting NADH:ubiquinone oxidoreductase subunit C